MSNKQQGSETLVIDIRNILYSVLRSWWLYLIFLVIAVFAGKLYLRYADFEYSSKTILLIKNTGRSGGVSEQSILLSEVGLSSSGKSLDNEIQILQSLTLMEMVVERLKLNVSYYRIGNIKQAELYTQSPFLVDSYELSTEQDFATYHLELQNYETFVLKSSIEDEDGQQFYFGVPFETDLGKFQINLNPKSAVVPGDYRLEITSAFYSAQNYQSKVTIERVGGQKTSSILSLSMLDAVPQKTVDILNTLVDVYNKEEIKDENQVYVNTLDFIEGRVASLVNELDSVEGGIQRFKSANELISNSASSSLDYTLREIRQALQQISDYEVRKDMLQSLETFLKQKDSYNLIPSNLLANTPILSGLVIQYNSLAQQYKKISATASDLNPARIGLEEQLSDVRELIMETVSGLKNDLQIPIAKIESNISSLKRSMGSVPGIEKRLIEKMRTQAVKEKLYLFLLQKREETALSKAVTTSKTRTIDKARLPGGPVYPRKKMIQAASIALGLLIPSLLLLLLSLFKTKVESEETITRLTEIPILGKISWQKSKENIVVKKGNRSEINEMFRLLRTKLSFLNQGRAKQKIVVTSSIPGEGKTFITINLGLMLALSGKKVLLLGLDLRKPKMNKYLEAKHNLGITNYLVGQNSLADITQKYEKHENLYFIASGAIPPNPSELILSDKMKETLEELEQQYDYILIDTPPIGLVSDALLLRDFADTMLVVVRQNWTKKDMISKLDDMRKKEEIKNVSIVFNGVKKGRGYYGYGNYDKGYYIDEA